MSYSPNDIAGTPDLMARLRLIRSAGLGPVTFRRLIEKHGCAAEVIAMLTAAAKKGTAKTSLAEPDALKAELDLSEALNVRYSFLGTEGYPALLAELPDAPAVLAMRGNDECLAKTAIAVVGARNCSAGGAKITRKICGGLTEQGFTVVSGLARGIDTAAHKAALRGGTIACLAGGIDVIYPKENSALYEDILETGLVVSEMPLGTKPQAKHFPRRNRIISGLSSGLVVIEAARRSGSLITAGYAVDQNRDVFAVPGSPLDPRSQGSNQLVRNGAALIQSAEDIITEYETMPLLRAAPRPAVETWENVKPQQDEGIEPVQLPTSEILALLSPDPIHIDELVRLSGIPANALLTEFTELEISGAVLRHAGGKYSRL